MTEDAFSLCAIATQAGTTLAWKRQSSDVLTMPAPIVIETGAGTRDERPDGTRFALGYEHIRETSDGLLGTANASAGGARYRIDDRWYAAGAGTWRLDRRLEVLATATGGFRVFRVGLELSPALPRSNYRDFHYFAPPAMYDLNDLNRDGLEDYLETRRLAFRDDRLNAMSLLAYSDGTKLGIALSRADLPTFDEIPDRAHDQLSFLQRSDIGSIGIAPAADDRLTLSAAYPFVERDACNALYVKERKPWGAYWPAVVGERIEVSYFVHLIEAGDMHEALWLLWQRRVADLAPQRVELGASLDQITKLRLERTRDYLMEHPNHELHPAGFVTNCHPQDGRQISNVIQYGFTGQNVLSAFNLLRAGASGDDRRKALRVIDFLVETAARTRTGLFNGLYNMDTRSFGNWWTGLLLPLAYAKPGQGLEQLMGPIYNNLKDVIEALAKMDGLYLRCAVEEYEPLLHAYLHEGAKGEDHPSWREAVLRFGEFLLSAQETDGAFRRAYTLAGEPISAPVNWFGQTEVQQKSSTATVVPLLLQLAKLTGDTRWREAAVRAGRYVHAQIIDPVKHNGGIHDSIYAKPQLIDGESIIFAAKALLELWKETGDAGFRMGALRGARLVASWMCLWDIPLPTGSTLQRFSFRSTGWTACDTPGAGYVHPMGLLAVPLLVETGLAFDEPLLLQLAELVQYGNNETVSVPGKNWGYAAHGLQEEGLLVSWWFADDPMFRDTAFGGRGKGEGNKTCLPWIAAVAIQSHYELLERYGTTEIAKLRMQSS
jgi:hypothetical protein